MANASEWLNEKIPEDQRAQATHLYICWQPQCGHGTYTYKCTSCINAKNVSAFPTYKFYYTVLEGELNLNSLVNLEELYISGGGSNKQKLTSLKIDKCNKLTTLTITHTTLNSLNVRENAALQNITLTYNQLGYLSLRSRANYKDLNLSYNKRIMFDLDDNILKSQVKRLINEIRNVKNTSIGDLKLEARKIEEENLEYQLAVIKDKLEYQVACAKDKLNEENQSLLEILLETQQEVLQSGNAFARNILEKVKKQLSNVLTADEIQDFLGKKVEMKELETQIKNLTIQEQETSE